jgi:hypothetical protein
MRSWSHAPKLKVSIDELQHLIKIQMMVTVDVGIDCANGKSDLMQL